MSVDMKDLDSLRIERAPQRRATTKRAPVYPWIVAGVLLLIGIVGWFFAASARPLLVRTVLPTVGSTAASPGTALNASGYVVARRQATVSAKTTGKVAEVLVEEGMMVTEGQLLARLDDVSVQSVYALAQRQLAAARIKLEENRVRLAEAERALERAERLRKDKLISEAQLDAAISEVAAMRARMASVRSEAEVADGSLKVRAQEIDDLLVRAPFSGIVISKDAQPGEIISPVSAGGGFTRTGIATIVDMDSREIELDVNEAFINRVKAGQKTQAVLDAYPDWIIASHVVNIVPAADRQKATVRVRVAFDQLDPRILPDMGIKVSFLEDAAPAATGRKTMSVPSSAVLSDGANEYVWRVVDGKAERVAVRAGARRNGQVEILSGIERSDRLIIEPELAKVADNAAVRIQE